MRQINKNDKLDLFDTSIYEDVIPKWVFERGESYFLEGKIKFINKKNNVYNFIAKGTKEYEVLMKFSDDNKIAFAKCNCPFYKKESKYCKHIAGSIYSIKGFNNHEIIKQEIDVALKETEKIKNKFEKLIKEKKYIISNSNNDDVYNSFYRTYNNAINKKDKQLLESELLNILYDLKNKVKILDFAYNELLKNKKIKVDSSIKQVYTSNIFLRLIKSIFTIIFNIVNAMISLFMIFINIGTKDKNKKSGLINSLEPWQQDLVSEGKYDETSFEEEEPFEDDDYYNEDV